MSGNRVVVIKCLLDCRAVYNHFPIFDEVSRDYGNSPGFSRSLRDLLRLTVGASRLFQLLLCHYRLRAARSLHTLLHPRKGALIHQRAQVDAER